MTPAERKAVEELVDLVSVEDGEGYTRCEVCDAQADGAPLRHMDSCPVPTVRALLAAPVTEPASVAELRGAIEEWVREAWIRGYYTREGRVLTPISSLGTKGAPIVDASMPHSPRKEAAPLVDACLESILARLDVTEPAAQRDAVTRMLAEIEDAARIDLSQLVGSQALAAIVERHLGPVAQRGEADEESAAREVVVEAALALDDALSAETSARLAEDRARDARNASRCGEPDEGWGDDAPPLWLAWRAARDAAHGASVAKRAAIERVRDASRRLAAIRAKKGAV